MQQYFSMCSGIAIFFFLCVSEDCVAYAFYILRLNVLYLIAPSFTCYTLFHLIECEAGDSKITCLEHHIDQFHSFWIKHFIYSEYIYIYTIIYNFILFFFLLTFSLTRRLCIPFSSLSFYAYISYQPQIYIPWAWGFSLFCSFYGTLSVSTTVPHHSFEDWRKAHLF